MVRRSQSNKKTLLQSRCVCESIPNTFCGAAPSTGRLAASSSCIICLQRNISRNRPRREARSINTRWRIRRHAEQHVFDLPQESRPPQETDQPVEHLETTWAQGVLSRQERDTSAISEVAWSLDMAIGEKVDGIPTWPPFKHRTLNEFIAIFTQEGAAAARDK